METFAQFHFLRPWWLLALLPALGLIIALWRRRGSAANWRRAIAADLLEHLLDRRAERRQRWPWLLLGLGWLLGALALAGPTWEKLPQPVLQQRDGLVIVLDLSLSMYAQDIKPSRLLRARYKVLDALKRRSEGLTGMVAYSGDAHVVAPLTDDTATVANLVPALAPDMMPLYGSDPVAGVGQALVLLRNAGYQHGRILLISDEITEDNIDAIAAQIGGGDWSLSVLGVGTEQGAPIPLPAQGQNQDPQQSGFLKQRDGSIVIAQLHRERFERLVRRSHGRYSDVRLDDSDLDALLPPVTATSAADTRSVQREFDQWRERGPWLVMLLLPLAAFACRRGWLLLVLLLPLSQPSHALEWRDLWQRPDQQGERELAAGDAAAAAQKFTDPSWRGSAQYRAGKYDQATRSFQQLDTPAAHYNRGNALAQAGHLQEAIAAYDKALAENPQLEDAKINRELVRKLLQQQQQKQQQKNAQGQKPQSGAGQNQQQNRNQSGQSGQNPQGQQQNPSNPSQHDAGGGDRHDTADNSGQSPQPEKAAPRQGDQQARQQPQRQGQQQGEQQQDARPQPAKPDDGKAGERPNASAADTRTPEQKRAERATEQWLRQIPDDPSGLLRRKVNYEHQQRERAGATRDLDQPLW
jgi:Ca-activated chloride channel family protein